MTGRIGHLGAACLATLALLAAGVSAHAQAIFTENFAGESIDGLASQGWIFRNQSDAPAGAPWRIRPGYYGPDGSEYLSSGPEAFHRGPGQSSMWAILPPIDGLDAGATVAFDAVTYWAAQRSDTVELRFSPSGGTSTGTGPADVGDFTQVLWSMDGNDALYWLPQEAECPGPGRLAFRYTWSNTASTYGGTVQLDGVVVMPAEGSGPPIPSPGETVRWTAAMSPVTFNAGDTTIPAGGTVIVDPGVTVSVLTPGRLVVEGLLHAQGAAGQPVTFTADNSGLVVAGEARLEHAVVSCKVTPEGRGAILISDSEVTAAATLGVGGRAGLISLTRCSIDTPWFGPYGQVAVRGCTFTGDLFAPAGYALVDGLTSSAPVEFVRETQPMLIDNVHVTGVTDAPAITLRSERFTTADFFFGPNNTLQGNLFPVKIGTGGIAPGSTIPAEGNINNFVYLGGSGGGHRGNTVHLPRLAVDYYVGSEEDEGLIQGGLEIEPGAVFRFPPATSLHFYAGHGDFMIQGLPGNPVRFEPLVPGSRWGVVALDTGQNFVEHAVLDGGGLAGLEGYHHVRETTITNAAIGMRPSFGFFEARGTTFLGNDIGVEEDDDPIFVGLSLDAHGRPNRFEGNTLAVTGVLGPNGEWRPIPAGGNWWGHPTGPSSAPAPFGGGHSGQGDPVTSNVVADAFVTERPDPASDTPPVVRIVTRPYRWAITGEKLFIEWVASDDRGVVSQEIQINDGAWYFETLVPDLPGDLRRIELTVPPSLAGQGGRGYESRIRIVARDAAGNESFDQFPIRIPYYTPFAQVEFNNDFSAGIRPGEEFDICYTSQGVGGSPRIFLDLGPDERWYMGPPGLAGCSTIELRVPRVSTDRARLALDASGNNNIDWYFSDYFTIRPDPRLGDAPPTVEMTSPSPWEQFTGGGVIPITWTASDDEGLRSFKIQASLNGGRTFHTIAYDLPGTARAYTWRLPASTGIEDLRLRVVAIDHRFQNSSSGDDRVLSIAPGAGPACPADWDQSGAVNSGDISAFLASWLASIQGGNLVADFSGDGSVNSGDISAFLAAWLGAVQGGC